MNQEPKAFVSYSHSDKEFVEKLAQDLRKDGGINVWIDKFEINPGDSLIQKIFSEGLSESQFFVIVLSNESTKSNWVKQELDIAMTQKLAGVTRIIPVLKETTEVPVPLRSLMYIDLSKDYQEGVRKLIKTMHGVSDKPPIGKIPNFVSSLKQSVGGLSREATKLGFLLLSTDNDESGYDPQLPAQKIKETLPDFTAEEINDAVDELESYGLVKAYKVLGNAPFYFAHVTATYALFLHFKEEGLDYDPEGDIKTVANAVAASQEVENKELKKLLNIPPGRINRAVSYLEEYGLAHVIRTMGTAPYNFRSVIATRQTREFVKNNMS
jgi:hypothetical protein